MGSNTRLGTICRIIDEHDVISFDVFDTLLLRNVLEPTDIFKIVEIKYYLKYGKEIDFHNIRIKAERIARKRSDNEDVTLHEIYCRVKELLGTDPFDLMQLEIETEKDFIVPNEEMKEIYNIAKSYNKKIYIISDMYLPEAVIKELLEINGFNDFDKLFVSSNYKASKATGNLFTIIRDIEKLTTSKWFHIGDNFHSDYKIPLQQGIKAFHYVKQKKPIDRKKIQSIGDSIVRSVQSNNTRLNNESYWYKFGWEIAAPIYVGLMFWLKEQLKGKDNIYFLSRDGYLPYRLYNMLKDYYPDLPDARYLLSSRRAFIYPQLLYESKDYALEILIAHNPLLGQKITVKEILDNIGLNLEIYADSLEKHRMDGDTIIDNENAPNVKQFLNSIWDDICRKLRIEEETLREYLDKMGLKEHSVINIFDIGWRGSTHLALQKFISKPVRGFYFGTTSNIYNDIKNRSFGYAFSQGRPKKNKKKIFKHIMIYELIFSAPEGSLIRFIKDHTGQVAPYQVEVEKNEDLYTIINNIHQGVIDLFSQVLKYKDFINISTEFSLSGIFNFVDSHKANDLKEFSKITNSVGIGESKDIKKYVTVYDLDYYLSNRKRCDKEAKYNLWKDAILIKDDQGRFFNRKEIIKLYNLSPILPSYEFNKLYTLIKKTIKNPKKAVIKLVELMTRI